LSLSHRGMGLVRGLCPSPEFFFSIFELRKANFCAFWVLFFSSTAKIEARMNQNSPF